jgi:hypothetical protein
MLTLTDYKPLTAATVLFVMDIETWTGDENPQKMQLKPLH